MAQKPVTTVEDIAGIALKGRRPGCEKGNLHEGARVQTAMYRVQPGSGPDTRAYASLRPFHRSEGSSSKFGMRANAVMAYSFSSPAHSVECRPVCVTNYRIRAKQMRLVFCSSKPLNQSSTTCRCRSAQWRPRCYSRHVEITTNTDGKCDPYA